mmetsp:Transcript_64402/g.172418  ORF Transcript_64402/g.172418 Transcript_64402/m.172418 type:complete len:344 (-) Transcript_64402:2072-3103(-)
MLRSLRSSSGEKRERVDCWKETVTELSSRFATAGTSRFAHSAPCSPCPGRNKSLQQSPCNPGISTGVPTCDTGPDLPTPVGDCASTADGLTGKPDACWTSRAPQASVAVLWSPTLLLQTLGPVVPSSVTGATMFRSISMHCRSSSSSSLHSKARAGGDAPPAGADSALAAGGAGPKFSCPPVGFPTSELLPKGAPGRSATTAGALPCRIPSRAAAKACMRPDGRFPGTVPKVAGNRRFPPWAPPLACPAPAFMLTKSVDEVPAACVASAARGLPLAQSSAPAAGGQLCEYRRRSCGSSQSSLEGLRIQATPGVDFARCGVPTSANASCSRSRTEASGSMDGKS